MIFAPIVRTTAFKPMLASVLPWCILMVAVSDPTWAQGFQAFGGSVASVRQEASQRERLDATAVGFNFGVSVTLTKVIALSGGVGLDLIGDLKPSSELVTQGGAIFEAGTTGQVFALQLALGLRTPALHFDRYQFGRRVYFGANVGREWLAGEFTGVVDCLGCGAGRDLTLGGSPYYVEPNVQIILFGEQEQKEWGFNIAWRVYRDGGDYKRRAILEVVRSF